jgi:hypothetical protein
MSQPGSRIIAVVVVLSLAAALAIPSSSYAQRLSPRKPGAGGIGGGPGVIRPPPIGAPTLSPTLPELLPMPKIETPRAPPAAVQVPAAPVVRFHCDLAPDSYECTKPGSADGDGDDETCICARDICRINGTGNRVCEKLQ